MDFIATFQVPIRFAGAFQQELVVLAQVNIPHYEDYILDAPNKDEILTARAIGKIKDYVGAGQLHGRIVELP